MPSLKRYAGVVIDCSDFNRFVEEVYGRKYSTVRGFAGDDRLGHQTYFYIDVDEYMDDKEYMESDEAQKEHDEFIARMKEEHPNSPWLWDESELTRDYTSFEDWEKLEGWAAHNDCPPIEEMVWHLRQDGHDVPKEFLVLVDW